MAIPEAIYAFALVSGSVPDALPNAPDGAPLEALETLLGNAIVKHVGPKIVNRLKSADTITGLQNVADWILYHDQVTKHIGANEATYPFGFATLFSSENVLVAALVAEKTRLLDYFSRVGGADEWAVKVSVKKQGNARLRDAAQANSGLEYLKRRKASTTETQEKQTTRAEALTEPLQALCRDWRRMPSALTPANDLEVVGNFAALVDRAEREMFHARVNAQSKSADSNTVLTCTGPWPPFSFRPKLATLET